MPNWASTYVVFYSEDPNKVMKAYSVLHRATGDEHSINMRSVLEKLNIAVPENQYIRSFFQELSCEVMKTEVPHYYFTLSMEEAWGENLFVINSIAHRFELEYVYMCEEPGCEVFVNTDTSGEFISTRYLIDAEDIWEYFSTEEELVEYFRDTFSLSENECKTYNDCTRIANRLVNNGNVEWFYVRRFESQ